MPKYPPFPLSNPPGANTVLNDSAKEQYVSAAIGDFARAGKAPQLDPLDDHIVSLPLASGSPAIEALPHLVVPRQ